MGDVEGWNMKVLVTDGGYENALAIVRSLGKRGSYVSTMSNNPHAVCFYSRYCKENILSPEIVDEEKYEKYLEKILSENKYDLLIPVSTGATLIVAKYKKMLQRYTNLVLPDYEKIVKAMDKKFVYKLSANLGIPYPRTIYPENIKQIESDIKDFHYPIVVKARHQTWFDHLVSYVFSKEELIDICIKMKRKTNEFPILQEYIDGKGYGFFAIYDKGKCKRIFMHKRIREIPPSGGASSCAESYYDEKLRDYGEKILDNLEWHGIAMVEFKKQCEKDDYKIMEINPRFWGSLDLAIVSGIDFPYYLCQIAEGKNLEYSEEYDKNVRFQWIFTREIRHITERPSSLKNFLKDLFNPKIKSDIQINDMLPNIIEARNMLKFYGIAFIKKLWRGISWN